MRSFFHNRLYPVMLIAVCLLISRYPMLNPSVVFSGMDFYNLIYPQVIYCNNHLQSGAVSLWCFEEFCGSPLFAAMQSSQAYPGYWILHTVLIAMQALGMSSHTLFVFQIFTYLHLLFAAVGVFGLCRLLLSCNKYVATLSGIIFACSGFMVGHLEQLNSIAAISLVPWYFLIVTSYLKNRRWDIAHFLGFALAVFLGLTCGHPQYLALSLLFGGVYVILWFAFVFRFRMTSFLYYGLFFSVATLAGLVLSAVQVIPAQELSAFSERIVPYANPDEPAFHWQYLPAFFVPGFFNKLAGDVAVPIGYTELGVYCGMPAAILFIVGCFSFRKGLRLVCAIVCALALLFSLGAEGGVSTIVQYGSEYFRNSRGSARALCIVLLFYSVVVAAGCEFLYVKCRHKLGNTLAFSLLMAVVFGVTVDFLVTQSKELHGRTADRRAVKLSGMSEKAPAMERCYRFVKNDGDYYLDYSATALEMRQLRGQPNLNMLQGSCDLGGYEEGLLPLRGYANFIRYYNRNMRDASPDVRLLSFLGVSRMETEYPTSGLNREDWKPDSVRGKGGLQVVHNLWPSSCVYDADVLLSSGELLIDIPWTSSKLFESMETTENTHPFSKVSSATLERASKSLSVRIGANSLEIATSSDRLPRELWISMNTYPGWKTSKGELSLIEPLIYSVKIPENAIGKTMKLTYAPFSFRLGCYVSLLGLLLLSACLSFVSFSYLRNKRRGHFVNSSLAN